MNNKGSIIACDVAAYRLDKMKPRLIRASVFYGEHDDTPLYGELDRGRIMLVTAGVVALVLLLVMWWLKRAR